MAKTVAETIREITRKHLAEGKSLLFGQCITAVGGVNNSVPVELKNSIIEFPMSDVSNMGIACGAAISGIRPIIVVRFQDFMWLNASVLVNYAAKSKDIFGIPTPIFVRALAKENAGCVHSSVLHSLFMHIPGIRVCAPMTPNEYREIWDDFMNNDDPMYVSEHRASFNNTEDLSKPAKYLETDITLFPISASRFNVEEARKQLEDDGIRVDVCHIYWLKPLKQWDDMVSSMEHSVVGLVIDSGFENCGASQSIAYKLMVETGKEVKALGVSSDISTSVSRTWQNDTPSVDRIVNCARGLVSRL